MGETTEKFWPTGLNQLRPADYQHVDRRKSKRSLSDAAQGFLVRLIDAYPSGLILDQPNDIAARLERSLLIVYQRLAELQRFRILRRGTSGAYYYPKVLAAWTFRGRSDKPSNSCHRR